MYISYNLLQIRRNHNINLFYFEIGSLEYHFVIILINIGKYKRKMLLYIIIKW